MNSFISKKDKIIFNCKDYKKWNWWNIIYNWKKTSYKKIFCLDNNKMNLEEIYEILHNEDNFNSDTAFILNSDLDFTKLSNEDYANFNELYSNQWNTFALIGGKYSDRFYANFYWNKYTIKVWDIDHQNKNGIWFFGVIWDSWKVYNLNVEIWNNKWNEWIWGFVWYNNWTIENCSIIVNTIKWYKCIWGFVWYNYKWTIKNCSAIINTIKWYAYAWGVVWYNYEWTIENSSSTVNIIEWHKHVWWFIWYDYDYDWKINNSVSKILTKSDKINNEYYYNKNLTEKPKNFSIISK